jgi:pyrroline-5-carboxylate reductase
VTAPRVAVLGAGALAGAMLSGWERAGMTFDSLVTVNRTAAKAAALSSRATALSVETDPDANRVAVRGADVVVIAVKPYMIDDLLPTIADAFEPGAVVITVAAGIRSERFRPAVPDSVAVVRAMPNTPSAVGRGVIGLVTDPAVPSAALSTARALLEPLGEVVDVSADQLDGIVAISGSGPAYVFLLIEKLTTAAIAQGFDPETASLLARQVFLGAAELLNASGEDPAELRRRVTSPNGTTERAIAVFEAGGLDDLFIAATQACRERAEELGRS